MGYSLSGCKRVGHNLATKQGLPGSSAGKESACNAGDLGSVPGLERPAGEGDRHSSILGLSWWFRW